MKRVYLMVNFPSGDNYNALFSIERYVASRKEIALWKLEIANTPNFMIRQ